eukprot:gene17309-35719_t
MWKIIHHDTILPGVMPDTRLPFTVPTEQFMVFADFQLSLVVARGSPLVIPPTDFREEEWNFDDEDPDPRDDPALRSNPYVGRPNTNTNTRALTIQNTTTANQITNRTSKSHQKKRSTNEGIEVVGLLGVNHSESERRTHPVENNTQGFEIADGYTFRKQVKSEDAYTTLPFRRCAPDIKRVVEFTTPDKAPFKKVEEIKTVLNIYHLRLRTFERSETLGPNTAGVFSQDADR